MTMIPYGDHLQHYGVKGMKWGVRRAEKKAARLQKKIDDPHSTIKTLGKSALAYAAVTTAAAVAASRMRYPENAQFTMAGLGAVQGILIVSSAVKISKVRAARREQEKARIDALMAEVAKSKGR